MRNKRKSLDQDDLRIVGDMARMAANTIGSIGGSRRMIKDVLGKVMDEMDMVSRKEFDRVQAMAERARDRQEELEEKLSALEAQLAPKKKKTAPKAKKAATKKKKTTKRKTKK